MMIKQWDEMSDEEQLKATFDKFFARFGVYDYCDYIGNTLFRFRAYHDGAWLEGYDIDPVIYWGA